MIESDFHPLGAIAFAEARGQKSSDCTANDVLIPEEAESSNSDSPNTLNDSRGGDFSKSAGSASN